MMKLRNTIEMEREGTNLEKRIEELEINLSIAEARAELAIRLVRYLCDEFARNGMTSWGADDLIRQFLDETSTDDPAVKIVRMDIVPGPDEATMEEAGDLAESHIRAAMAWRNEIRAEIRRHERDPS